MIIGEDFACFASSLRSCKEPYQTLIPVTAVILSMLQETNGRTKEIVRKKFLIFFISGKFKNVLHCNIPSGHGQNRHTGTNHHAATIFC